MPRTCIAVLSVLLLAASTLRAEELKAVVAKVEETKIVVTIDGADKTYDLDKDLKVIAIGKKNKPIDAGGITAVKAGQEVTLTTETQNDKTTITQIKLPGKKKKTT